MRRIPGSPEHPLWIGNARDARDPRAVLDAGIEAVVDLAMEEPPAKLTRELMYLRFPLLDGDENPPGVLRAAVVAVRELIRGGVPTLVACSAGMSRSPAVLAAALAGVTGRGVDEVLASVLGGGPGDVSPGLWRAVREVLAHSGD